MEYKETFPQISKNPRNTIRHHFWEPANISPIQTLDLIHDLWMTYLRLKMYLSCREVLRVKTGRLSVESSGGKQFPGQAATAAAHQPQKQSDLSGQRAEKPGKEEPRMMLWKQGQCSWSPWSSWSSGVTAQRDGVARFTGSSLLLVEMRISSRCCQQSAASSYKQFKGLHFVLRGTLLCSYRGWLDRNSVFSPLFAASFWLHVETRWQIWQIIVRSR